MMAFKLNEDCDLSFFIMLLIYRIQRIFLNGKTIAGSFLILFWFIVLFSP